MDDEQKKYFYFFLHFLYELIINLSIHFETRGLLVMARLRLQLIDCAIVSQYNVLKLFLSNRLLKSLA